MSNRSNVALLYDGSFDGLLSAVFAAYERRISPSDLLPDTAVQQTLNTTYLYIPTEEEKAFRVAEGVKKRMGTLACEKIFTAYLSDQPHAGKQIFSYVQLGMKEGLRVHRMLTDDRVIALNKTAALVTREAHMLTQFARFSAMENGIYYAVISPTHRVLPLIIPHFFDRFRDQPFLIHDTVHGEVGISRCSEWLITSDEGLAPPDYAAEEEAYRAMWKTFYRTVSIRERYNPALQRQMMPKKYWKHIVEMQDFVVRKH